MEALELDSVSSGLVDFTRLPRLTSLYVVARTRLPLLIEQLPATLRELGTGVDDATLLQLAQTPLAATLEHLHFRQSRLRRDASAFAAFPRLRSLDLGETDFGDAGYSETASRALATFTAAKLPALRELRLSNSHEPHELLAVATAFGDQLELLDLSNQFRARAVADELRAKVAGDVLLRGATRPRRPLRASRRYAEPGWDHHVTG